MCCSLATTKEPKTSEELPSEAVTPTAEPDKGSHKSSVQGRMEDSQRGPELLLTTTAYERNPNGSPAIGSRRTHNTMQEEQEGNQSLCLLFYAIQQYFSYIFAVI